MKLTFIHRACAVAVTALAITSSYASAQDTAFDQFDLLMFFRNPNGSVGNEQVVTFSLGSTTNLFRAAATPGDPSYGTTTFLGNVNSALSGNYGTEWTSLSANSTIFAGTMGNSNTLTTQFDNTVENQDYARTVYFSRRRTAAGSVGSANSTNYTLPAGTSAQAIIASNVDGSNNVALGQSNPFATDNSATVLDTLNPINGSNVPGTAYGQISAGVMGRLLATSSYSLGSVNNIVLGLDLYRGTPLANQTGSWEQINGISGVTDRVGYYIGTVTLSSNGDVNFVAVPEPSVGALLALGGGLAFWFIKRRKSSLAHK